MPPQFIPCDAVSSSEVQRVAKDGQILRVCPVASEANVMHEERGVHSVIFGQLVTMGDALTEVQVAIERKQVPRRATRTTWDRVGHHAWGAYAIVHPQLLAVDAIIGLEKQPVVVNREVHRVALGVRAGNVDVEDEACAAVRGA